MTTDEHKYAHQLERVQLWATTYNHAHHDATECADKALAEFDKRFPAPSAAVTYDPVTGIFDGTPSAAAPVEPVTIRDTRLRVDIPAAELASLRQKARLWDAVASGKVVLLYDDRELFAGRYDKEDSIGWQTGWFNTAEEAVEAAIAAGALK